MGFAPFDFEDPRPCLCRQNCPDWRKPVQRWWAVWSNPPPTLPILGEGILFEFDPFGSLFRDCFYKPVIFPPGFFALILRIFPQPPVPGPFVTRLMRVFTDTLVESFARKIDQFILCDVDILLPGLPLQEPFGDCQLTAVRWFEDANDVPH